MSVFDPAKTSESWTPVDKLDPAIWTLQRQHLLDWFRKEAPSLAPAYEAAVRILNMPSMPAKVHLVCHVVRDIYARLPEILDGEYRRQNAGEVYRSHVDNIDSLWVRSSKSLLNTHDPSADAMSGSHDVTIAIAAARAVENLLEKHRELKKQPRSAEILAGTLYRRFAESGLGAPRRLVDTFETERDWFTKRAHLVIEEKKLPTEDGLVEHFASFENALYSLVGQYFAGKKEIDAILQQTNQ